MATTFLDVISIATNFTLMDCYMQ